jgi:HEAT repeat protein
MISLHHLRACTNGINCREVLDCASPLALFVARLTSPKRQRTAAVQNAGAFTASALLALIACCTFAPAASGGVEQTVNELIPKLAAQNVEDRYGPQMELQGLGAKASRPGAEAERAELMKILAAKATDATVPQPARVWIVRQLEYFGASESVAALATLLGGQDVEVKDCARRALEKNPDPAAGERLRAALKQGGDVNWRIGLIQSLGQRRDAAAVELIRDQLSRKETAASAVAALGKIADEKAVLALWQAYDDGAPGAADALVTAGNRLLADGDKGGAVHLFARLYSPSLTILGAKDPAAPVQVRSAALIGWAGAADPELARSRITEALQQKEARLQFAAVTAATVAYGKEGASALLAPLLPKLSPTAAIYALRVLDAAAERQIIAAASNPDETVRLAALERLGQVGDAEGVATLLQAAAGEGASAQEAAAALARISGPDAGAALSQCAGQGDNKARVAAITALAQRNDSSASPALLKYAGEADPQLSRAACDALAKVGTDGQLDGLIQLVQAGKTPGAADALQAVASRTADKSGAAQKLVAQTKTAEPQQLPPLFDVLAMLGGNEALTAVSSFASNSNEAVKDGAIRALANWPDFGATQPLLVIAADPNGSRVHSVLAIQAVVRLVKASEKEPAAARLDAAQAAMKACKRDQEKKLVVSAFASVPDVKAADVIKALLSDPGLKNEAGLAGMTLAQALSKTERPAARSLAQAIKDADISADLNRKAETMLSRR